MEHDIRLLERAETLNPGDNATVLRVQAGPNRRSRPAAVINHSRNTWVRTAPDATALLARSGVTRGLNWWLAVLAIALTAVASVWPLLHAFLAEMNGAMMASVPAFDVFAELNMLVPSLAGWRLENNLSTGLLDTIASLDLVATDQLTEWGLAAGGLVLGAAAYFARSWRLIYVPVFAGFALAAGAILGGPEATLALCGGVLTLFLLGGLVNRIRDAGRFNARVERLAEHVLRNPPQEGIRTGSRAARDTSGLAPAAAAASAIAAAAAVAEGSEDDAADTAEAGTDTTQAGHAEAGDADAAPAAAPGDDAANGEVEAGPSLELPPTDNDDEPSATTASQSAAPEASGEAEAAHSEAVDTADEASAVAGDDGSAGPDTTAEADPAAAAMEAAEASEDDDTEAAMAAVAAAMLDEDGEPDASAGVPAAAEDDDLPSLEAVAAAAALNAAERETAPDGEAAETPAAHANAVEDERTMALAPPPPMPAASVPVPPEAAAAAVPQDTAESVEAEAADAGDGAADDANAEPVASAPADPSSDRLAEVETRVEAAVDAASRKSAAPESLVDDPLMEDGPDPMMPKSHAGDFAPGAPDLEVEPDPVE